jgi:hypothetical protein
MVIIITMANGRSQRMRLRRQVNGLDTFMTASKQIVRTAGLRTRGRRGRGRAHTSSYTARL